MRKKVLAEETTVSREKTSFLATGQKVCGAIWNQVNEERI
jgi:hypothetical protein